MARTIEINALRKQLKYGSKEQNPDPDVEVPPKLSADPGDDASPSPASDEDISDADDPPDLPTEE